MDIFKPLNAIDYKTYKLISKYDAYVAYGMLAGAVYTENFPLFLCGGLSYCLDLYLSTYKSLYNVKEIHELDLLLQEFLLSYSKLDKTFSLENPIEIMLLYTHLLNNGYLSFQKKHEIFSDSIDYVALNNYQVLAGEFKCRHIAALLQKILSFENISSSVLLTHQSLSLNMDEDAAERIEEIKLIIKFLEEEDYTTEEFNKVSAFIEKLWREGKIKDTEAHISENIKMGNHAITAAKYNGKNYYLDSTNEVILYKRVLDGVNVLTNGLNLSVPFVSFWSRYSYAKRCENFLKVRQYLKGTGSTYEEELAAQEKVTNIYQNNQDILEDFYRGNEPLYEEMTEQLVRVRKIMQPKRIPISKTEI